MKQQVAGDNKRASHAKAHVAGKLPAATQDRSVTIRLPGSIVDRVKTLIPAVRNDPMVLATRGGGAGVGVSAVVRLALLEGLVVLEKRILDGGRKT